MFNIKKQIDGDYSFDLDKTQRALKEIAKTLKTEFIDIDEQIDTLIESIKPWLFFRDTLSKPLVINQWGMTGFGKSSVTARLLELLTLTSNSYSLNASQLNTEHPMNSLLFNHFNKNNYPIVILDDIQNYKCKDASGGEFEEYNTTVWEFIDTGICEYQSSYYLNAGDTFGIDAMNNVIDMLLFFGNTTFNRLSFKLSDDELRLLRAITRKANERDINSYDDDIVWGTDKEKNKIVMKGNKYETVYIKEYIMKDLNMWFTVDNTGSVFTVNDRFITKLKQALNYYKIECTSDLREYLSTLSFNEFADFIISIHDKLVEATKKIVMDYSKALIFITGNVDEAFGVFDDMSPDVSADEFHKITKKVNIVDIKKALVRRFRIEHIARLGNTHIIYPSLAANSYRKIIVKQLTDYSNYIFRQYGVNLEFDDTVHKIIYREAVFPTMGVRNVITTINDMIKSKVANSFLYAIDNNIQYDTLRYSYKNKIMYVEFLHKGEVKGNTHHQLIFRVDALRKNRKDDRQALTAIHEAGHAIMQILTFNKLPVQIFSVTANADMGGFTGTGVEETDILNTDTLAKKLGVLMGGKAAEWVVFETISDGGSQDIKEATRLILHAYRDAGMRHLIIKRSITPQENTVGREFDEETVVQRAELELKEICSQTEQILRENMKLLLKLGEYLTFHPTIGKKKLVQIIRENSNIDVSGLVEGERNFGYKDKLMRMLSK